MSDVHLRHMTHSMSRFSADFHKTLSSTLENNFICSPLSVGIVLAMATEGARGETEKQLCHALHLAANDTAIKNGFQAFVDSLNNIKAVDVKIANKIFTANRFNINPDFQASTENWFRSETQSLDFEKCEEASETINNWCAGKTNSRIKNIIEPDDLKDAALVLVNAVYFKGNWAEKFDSALTSPQSFHVDGNTIIEVPMMHKSDKFNFGDIPGLDAQYVEIPYQSTTSADAVSMFIILPLQAKGLDRIEANLHEVDFSKLQGRKNMLYLWLPKFKIESKFDLQEILQKMGIREMFDNNANFKGISEAAPLKVKKVIQKAFIEVNEEGSEAAAVTGMQMMAMCLPPMLKVNRPFFCAIVTRNTGLPLFQARVTNPTCSQ